MNNKWNKSNNVSYKIKYEFNTGVNGKEVFEIMDFGNGWTWVKNVISYDEYMEKLVKE